MRYVIFTSNDAPEYFFVKDAFENKMIATFDLYDDAELFCLAKNGLLGG